MRNINSVLQSNCHSVWILPVKQVSIEDKLVWLSAEESNRADRFRVVHARNTYILAHALKRYLLSSYLNVDADQLSFVTGEKGKPFCESPGAPHFNISHCDDCVLVGLSSVAEVGVDVESVERTTTTDLSSRVLNATQQQQLAKASNPDHQFMIFWTQKEAISKALGLGLSIDFTRVECSGRVGQSMTEFAGQSLALQTLILSSRHAVSAATLADKSFELYTIKGWHGTSFEAEAVPFVE